MKMKMMKMMGMKMKMKMVKMKMMRMKMKMVKMKMMEMKMKMVKKKMKMKKAGLRGAITYPPTFLHNLTEDSLWMDLKR